MIFENLQSAINKNPIDIIFSPQNSSVIYNYRIFMLSRLFSNYLKIIKIKDRRSLIFMIFK